MTQLASCPMCASRGEIRDEGPFRFYAVCEYNCVRQVGHYGTKEAAADQWNRRRALLDKLETILEDALKKVRDARFNAIDSGKATP